MSKISPDESLDLIQRLKSRFDDESVAKVLQAIESSETPRAFDWWFITILLSGRGARLLYPRIECWLKSDLSLSNIARLSEYLPKDETADLLDRADVREEHIISEVEAGHFPPIRILSREVRERIFQSLRNSITPESSKERAVVVLEFLLSFDKTPLSSRLASEESIKAATEWCTQFADDASIRPILAKLLWMDPTPELIQIADFQLSRFEWTMESNFLLTGLMEATRKAQKKRWIDDWFQRSEPSDLDGWIVSEWIRTTNCIRRALLTGKNITRSDYFDRSVLHCFAVFSHRKAVSRWMNRFIKSHIDTEFMADCISEIVRLRPTKRNCAYAKQVLQSADAETAYEILLALVKHTSDPEVVELAKHLALKFPNAPDSFTLMCLISRSDPDTAVPWIAEWIRTAMPDHVIVGLSYIIAVSPTPEYLQMAREWLGEVSKKDLPVSDRNKARLISVLIKIDPKQDVLDQAAQLLEAASDNTLPALRRLSLLLNQARSV